MTERKCAVRILNTFRRLFLRFDLLCRFGNLHKIEHDKRQCEDADRNEKRRIRLVDRGSGHITHQVTDENRNDRSRNRVQRAAELDQLVAPLTAAAERVQHRVDHGVEHTHRETGHKSPRQVDGKGHVLRHDTREELRAYADDTDGNRSQSGLFVTDPLEQHTGRNAHESIGDEIGGIAQLRHPVGYAELVLDDYAERIGQSGHERNHREQREHHRDGQRIILVFCRFHLLSFRLNIPKGYLSVSKRKTIFSLYNSPGRNTVEGKCSRLGLFG